jgi:hypothetical protein
MIETRARMCAQCGYVSQFGDLDHLHKLRDRREPVSQEEELAEAEVEGGEGEVGAEGAK